MDDSEIRRAIRRKLGDGHIPRALPQRTWGGFGSETLCAACDRPIERTHPCIEAECGDGARRDYHLRCAELVEQECAGQGLG